MAEKRRQRRLQRLFAATAGSFEERDLVSLDIQSSYDFFTSRGFVSEILTSSELTSDSSYPI